MSHQQNKISALVVGDLMLDESIYGTANRLTPEGPVPVILKSKRETTLGGAGFVARIISDLGIGVALAGMVGKDESSSSVFESCREDNIDSSQIVKIDGLTTTKKTRIYASGHLVARLDEEDKFEMTKKTVDKCLASLLKLISNTDIKVCIISDYNKGFCNDFFIKSLIKLCEERNIVTLVDPKTEQVEKFSRSTLIKPNDNEASKILGVPYDNLPEPQYVVKKISEELNIPNILYTRGAKGMILYANKKIIEIPAIKQEVFNVVGAGDTVLAGLCAGIINGLSLEKSSFIANDLAGEMISKLSRKIKPSIEIKEKFHKQPNL